MYEIFKILVEHPDFGFCVVLLSVIIFGMATYIISHIITTFGEIAVAREVRKTEEAKRFVSANEKSIESRYIPL